MTREWKVPLVDVAVPVPDTEPITYRLLKPQYESAVVGRIVQVPLKSRVVSGVITDVRRGKPIKGLKSVVKVRDDVLVIPESILRFTRWVADYYLCSWGEALKATLPIGLMAPLKEVVVLVHRNGKIWENIEKDWLTILDMLQRQGTCSLKTFSSEIGSTKARDTVKSMEKAGLVELRQVIRTAGTPIVQKWYRIADTLLGNEDETWRHRLSRAPKQLRVMEVLTVASDGLPQEDLVALTGAGPGSINSLIEKGFLTTELRTIPFRIKDDGVIEELPGHESFTQEQSDASDFISDAIANPNQSKPILIFGCTGSGKTLLYIEAIRNVLKLGRTALVLVPEISLTPQTVRRFRTVFGDQVAVQHSAIPPRERATLWQQIMQGQYPVVVGARSAVFAPLPRLGLIVVDEEHSPTFKQFDPAPRYHARDAALMRAKVEGAAIILGSATPSLESFYNTTQGRYHRIDLTSRADEVPMPQVRIIDRTHKSDAKPIGSAFTSELITEIKDKIDKNEQVILLQNRRGFSTFIRCLDCGYVPMCKRCDITMSYHKRGHQLRCHYCGSKSKTPTECRVCRSTRLDYAGTGTQRVEEELHVNIPGLKLVRMDLDTTSERGSHQRILSAFQQGDYDVLLGTQMVAKGLDLPKVTLVGVISADTELFLPDFRASERTFALLSQAAGRAGRREKQGVVLIQTYHPNNALLEPVMHHDYREFYRTEITSRQDLGYPPFSRLILIRFSGKHEPQAVKAAERFRESLEERTGKLEILGPAAAAVTRVKDRYQYQILVKSAKQHDPSGEHLRHAVSFTKRAYAAMPGMGKASVVVDVDPMGFV